MRRCPKCNQEFTDEWLTFCTQDGTTLVDVTTSPTDPPPTLVRPMPPSVSPTEQPTLDMPDRYTPPPVQYIPPPPMQAGWMPPPPPGPVYVSLQHKTLAVTSMVLGIVSITIGWCCSFGILTSPIALVLGIVSLVQIKNDPAKNGGKGFAISGIIMGALYILIFIAIILLYGIGIFLGALNS